MYLWCIPVHSRKVYKLSWLLTNSKTTKSEKQPAHQKEKQSKETETQIISSQINQINNLPIQGVVEWKSWFLFDTAYREIVMFPLQCDEDCKEHQQPARFH